MVAVVGGRWLASSPWLGGAYCLLAQGDQKLPINRLDPPTRTTVVMALLALVLLGITIVVCIRLGGRWARRMARTKPTKPDAPPLKSDWEPRGR